MATDLQHFIVLTSGGKWTKAGPQPAAKVTVADDMFVVLASGPSLAAAGVDINSIKALDFGDFVELSADYTGKDVDVHTRELLSHVRLAHIEPMVGLSLENLRTHTIRLSAALNALRKIAPESILKAVEQMESAGARAAQASLDSADGLYQVLTAKEMADRMKLTAPVVYQREAAGELFAVLEPYRKTGRLFPAFQLSPKLNHPLLKQVIQAYRDADVNTTLLWSFLRTPQKIFANLTPIEMLVGGIPPAYEGLKPEERSEAILDVVAEELSRVR